MENDPREIDWPEKQVARLDGLIVENSKAIDTVSEELAATARAVDAHNGRISALENALTAYGIPVGGRIAVERPDPFGLHGTRTRDLDISDGAPERLEFSPPIGGVAHEDKIPQMGAPWSVEDTEKDRISGIQAMGREQYERGLSAGKDAALTDARRRVEQYMQGHFSGATIRGVLEAMRADEESEPCGCSACAGERVRG